MIERKAVQKFVMLIHIFVKAVTIRFK